MQSNRELVIVTGSSGYIGSELCERLSASYHVIGFDRPGVPHPPPSATRVDVDLGSRESVEQAFEFIRRFGSKIASVVHLAAYYDFSGRPSSKYEEITVQGTGRLLKALKRFDLDQFVFSSTMLVHAPTRPGDPINEESWIDPKWDYPKSKVKTEDLIRNEKGEFKTVMVRMAGVYDDQCHSIPLSNQIQRIYERSLTSHFFPGDTSHGQSFVHLSDIVDLLQLLVDNRLRLPQEWVMLAGEPKTVSYGTLQRELGLLIHGKPWKTFRIPKTIAKGGAQLMNMRPGSGDTFIKPWMIDRADDHFELDISRAKKGVGWEPRKSLQTAIKGMVKTLTKDPLRWYKENHLTPPSSLLKKAGLIHHVLPADIPAQPRREEERELAGTARSRGRSS